MNFELLLAGGLALGLLMVGVLLLRRRADRPVATPGRPPLAMPTPAPTPVATPAAGPAGAPSAALVDAQRQATTEALRQARQRMADDTARAQAERRARSAELPVAPRSPLAPEAPGVPMRPAVRMAPAAPAAGMARPLASSASPARPHRNPHPNPHPQPHPPPPARPPMPMAPLPAATPPATRAPLVLLADDSKVVRVKTGRLLEKQGWRVLLAEDGDAALQALEQHLPDLLITDVEMPGLDGFSLTRRVRAHPRCARLPVIMITSSDARHRADADAAGVDLLLGKPYAEDTLVAQAQRLLGRRSAALH